MYRIINEADPRHIISTMQNDSTITYIQHSKICVQEVTSQYNKISDW